MKKQLPTHNDEPSIKAAPKVLKVEEPNYEGTVKQGKYEVEEHISIHTDTQPRSKSGDPYPIPDHEIDIYSVDTRIWDRIDEMGGGDGGGPHTHDDYATKTELTTGLATKSDDPHTHSEYALADHTHEGDGYDDTALTARVAQNETDIAGLEAENNSQNTNIQANATAIAGKADADHTHEGGGSGMGYTYPVLEADFTGSYQAGLYPQAAGNFVMDTDPTGTFYLNHFVGGLLIPATTRNHNFNTNGGCALWGIETSSGNYVNVLRDAEQWKTWGGDTVGVIHSAGDHAQGQFEMAVGAIEQATADDLSAISAAWSYGSATDAYHLIGTYDWFFSSNNIIFHAHMYSLGLGGSTKRVKPTTFSQKAWEEYLAKREPNDE